MDHSDEVLALRSSEIGWVLGRAVRRLRERRQISQEALARRLEVSRETIRRIEFGEGTTFATLDRVVAALDYDVAELIASADAEDAATRVYLQARAQTSWFCWPKRSRALSPRRVMHVPDG